MSRRSSKGAAGISPEPDTKFFENYTGFDAGEGALTCCVTRSKCWFTYYGGWLANDLEITQNGHSKTDAGPALAVYNGLLYLAYKGSGSDEIWYNVFDGTNWMAEDIKVTRDGRVHTARGPALAVFPPFLFMAYRDNS